MENNQITNLADIQSAAEVAHESICTLRRHNSGLLTKEGKKLLLQLSDAAHNLPLMISPNNKSWRLDELHKDVANCRRLIQQINETEMYQNRMTKIMNNEKEKEDKSFWLLWLFAALLLIITIVAHNFWKDYLDEVVPAEEIAQLSPEIKNKIKQEVKGCEIRGHSVTWINETAGEPYTRRDINNLKACLQHEAEGKDKIASDMNAYYEQKKALESQINSAK